MLYRDTCSELPKLSSAQRQAFSELATSAAQHAETVSSLAVLHCIEQQQPPAAALIAERQAPRIVFWNLERCKYVGASAALLGNTAADVILLCEMDLGMARSGQRHTTRDLARELDMGYVFATEYVELGLGDERERLWHASERNREGLHGAAILSPYPLQQVVLIRLDDNGDWFDGSRGERRIGGRIALAAMITTAALEFVAVSVHLESHSDPQQRTDQMAILLDAVDDYSAGLPVIIGGDFNSKTVNHEQGKDTRLLADLVAQAPQRFINPVAYEPLFALAAERGYDWQACNTAEATQRSRPDGTPQPPFGRLDWFFSRDLVASEARTIAAIDDTRQAISDHELLSVCIRQ